MEFFEIEFAPSQSEVGWKGAAPNQSQFLEHAPSIAIS